MAEGSTDAAPAKLDVMFKPSDAEATSGQIKLLGSRGRDDLRLDLVTPPQSLDLDVDINLREGNDLADVSWLMERERPRPSELPMIDAVFNILGGRGDDTIRVDLNLAPAQGTLSVLVGGDEGNDRLSLLRRGHQGPAFVGTQRHTFLIDGGADRDRCQASQGVEETNCEA